jgi:hypothetical protein
MSTVGRPARWLSTLGVLGAIIVGCSSSTGPTTIAGSWNNGCSAPSLGGCFEMSLTQSGDTVSGSADWDSQLYFVGGTYKRPNLMLVLVLDPGVNVGNPGNSTMLTGTVSSQTMTMRTEGTNPQTFVFHKVTAD